MTNDAICKKVKKKLLNKNLNISVLNKISFHQKENAEHGHVTSSEFVGQQTGNQRSDLKIKI
jgi:hypothetical protein